MPYPCNQLGFDRLFKTDKDCLDYLLQLKQPEGFHCLKCGNKTYWLGTREKLICKKCRAETSITANTLFHKSRLPLGVLFRAMWWIIAQKNAAPTYLPACPVGPAGGQGVSAQGLQRVLGIGSYETAWGWLHKFRRLIVMSDREKLSGMVEIDETLVGGKKSGKRGRGAEGKTLVVMALEINNFGTGRVRLMEIPDATRQSLNAFIKANIEKGTTITTDGWKGYVDINKMPRLPADRGYKRIISDQTKLLDGEHILPHVHRIASLLKKWLLGTHQSYVTKNYLQYYLDEFVFRHNRRKSKSRGLLFYTLIQQAAKAKPIKDTKKRE